MNIILKNILFLLAFFISPMLMADPIRFAIHPYLTSTELIDRFSPLTDYLSTVIDTPIEITISTDYEDHIQKIVDKKVEIAYIGPAAYIKLTQITQSFCLLGRLEINYSPYYRGVIFTTKNNKIKKLSQLNNASFAFGDKSSTMSTILPRYLLQEADISLEKLKKFSYLNNHQNVILAVLMNHYDAGAVVEEVYLKYQHKGLKVLAYTPYISEHLILATEKLSTAHCKKIQQALITLSQTLQGQSILKQIKPQVTGILPVSDYNYNNLRSIFKALEEKP